MMPRTSGFVAFASFSLLMGACGSTSRNDDKSDTSASGTDGSIVTGSTTGSGGATTQGVTAGVNTGSGTGTGGTTSTTCPSFEPAAGSTCAAESQSCVYVNCEPPDYNDHHQLTCMDGAWLLTRSAPCDIDVCPQVPPEPGSTCDDRLTPGTCSFVDACGAVHEFGCVEGAWQATDGAEKAAPAPGEDPVAPVPTCPTYPPYLGDACCPTQVPEMCDYTPSATDGAAGASFIILPTASTSSGSAEEPPPTLNCAICTPEMKWGYCPAL